MTDTIFNRFIQDSRTQSAKKQLVGLLKEYQAGITAIRPPLSDLQTSYQECLDEFSRLRGGKLLLPYLGSGMGNGALVELADGSVKYDFINGIGVYWGHAHPDIVSAALDGALQNTVIQGNLQQNIQGVEVARILVKESGMDHCFFASSGAMAAENALKIAFQKRFPARRILAFERCFMGRTLLLSQITDKPAFREGLPDTAPIDYIPFYEEADPEGSTQRALHVLKTLISRYPNGHAAMVFEFIQGEGGYYAGAERFFKVLMEELKQTGIPILGDEIQTFGRLPRLFAFQYFNLSEYVDSVTVGKLTQICATLFKSNMAPRPGLLSQTFTGAAVAFEAAKVILNQLIHGGFLGEEGKIAKIHEYFVAHLKVLSEKYPHAVQGPFGCGAMIAFTPFNGNKEKADVFVQALFKEGLICFTAGQSVSRIRFLVPMGAITFDDIDRAVEIIEGTLLNLPFSQ